MMRCSPNRAGVQRALVGIYFRARQEHRLWRCRAASQGWAFSMFLAGTFCNPLPGHVAKNQHCLQAWTACIGSCSYSPDVKEAPK